MNEVKDAGGLSTALAGAGRKPVVVEFYGDNCGACTSIAPAMAQCAERYRGKVVFCKVNCSHAPDLATQYKIRGIPTFIFFYQGQQEDHVTGADMTKVLAAIEAMLKKFDVFSGKGHQLAPAPSGARRNPWADPSFVPPGMRTTAEPPQESKEAEVTVLHDARMAVDKSMLKQLLEMGFSQTRAEKALILTGNKGLDEASDWIAEHQDDADIDEILHVVGASSKGVPLGVESEEEVDDDVLDQVKKEKARQRKQLQKQLGEPSKPVSEMTKEEKLAHLEKMKAARKNQKEKEAKAEAKEKEARRRERTKKALDANRKREEEEKKRLARQIQKEKQEEKERRRRIKEKIRKQTKQ